MVLSVSVSGDVHVVDTYLSKGQLMLRVCFLFLFACCGVLLTAAMPARDDDQVAKDDLDALKQRRVHVLAERVAVVQSWVDNGKVGAAELLRPQIDHLNARLDYAESDDQRKNILQELITKYDKLIELAEFEAANPVAGQEPGTSQPLGAMSDSLFLQSEKLRLQVALHSL